MRIRLFFSLFLKEFTFLLILFVGVPATLAIILGWNSVIPILIWFQFLLMWVQAEIALQQQVLFTQQFKPTFDVQLQEAGYPPDIIVFLTNTSSKPAYNLFLWRVLDSGNNPVLPKLWEKGISSHPVPSLPPGKQCSLCLISHDFDIEGYILEVSYHDHLGEEGTVHIGFLGKKEIFLVPGKQRLPSILLNKFENVRLSWQLWRGRGIQPFKKV